MSVSRFRPSSEAKPLRKLAVVTFELQTTNPVGTNESNELAEMHAHFTQYFQQLKDALIQQMYLEHMNQDVFKLVVTQFDDYTHPNNRETFLP